MNHYTLTPPAPIVEEHSGSMLQFPDYAIVWIDLLGKVINCNSGVHALFGYEPSAFVGRNFSDCYTSEDKISGQPWHHLKVASEEGRCETENWKNKSDGVVFFANSIITALYDHSHLISGFVMITRDISTQKKAEYDSKLRYEDLIRKLQEANDSLAMANEEVENLSQAIIQKLRKPLQAINDRAASLKEIESNNTVNTIKVAESIIEKSTSIEKFVKSMVSYSKMVKYYNVYDNIDMTNMALSCLDSRISTDDSKVYCTKVNALPTCKGDPEMLKHIWMQLIDNAIKYSADRTKVDITIGHVESSESNIYFVKDKGCGFCMKSERGLFRLFTKNQQHSDRSGCDLAIVKLMLKQHHGEIWAESVRGRGATFYFSIPK